jgi:hypothetical protein
MIYCLVCAIAWARVAQRRWSSASLASGDGAKGGKAELRGRGESRYYRKSVHIFVQRPSASVGLPGITYWDGCAGFLKPFFAASVGGLGLAIIKIMVFADTESAGARGTVVTVHLTRVR